MLSQSSSFTLHPPFSSFRYILACGADENSASTDRIEWIFQQYGGNAERLHFDGFAGFYKAASRDRPLHVWNDLAVFNFNAATIWSQMNDYKPPEGEYAVILENFLRAMAFEDDDVALKLAEVFFAKVNVPNGFPRAEFTRQMTCDGKWRRKFMQNDGWNVLLKIIFRIPKWTKIRIRRNEFQLRLQVFKDMLDSICCGQSDALYDSIQNIHMQYEESAEFEQIASNVLIHSICINAKIGIMGKRIDFLDEIPRKIVSAHSNVLIMGYIRMNVDIESLPDDVVNLLLLFF